MSLSACIKRSCYTALVCGSALVLASCGKVQTWLQDMEAKNEAQHATQHENPSPQPTSAMYVVELPDGSAQQTNMSFNGQGIARIFDASEDGGPKTIVDYNVGAVTREVNHNPWQTQTDSIDPFSIPAVYDAKSATAAGARAIGSGYMRGHEYHKFIKTLPNNASWEIWTDDDSAFPVFYQSTQSGKSTTWRLQNAWVDQGLLDREVFFDFTKPDPPSPAEQAEQTTEPTPPAAKTQHPTTHHKRRYHPR